MTTPTETPPTDPIRDAFEAMIAFFICLIGPRPHRKITPAEEIGALAACEVETDFEPDEPPPDLIKLRDLIQRAAEERARRSGYFSRAANKLYQAAQRVCDDYVRGEEGETPAIRDLRAALDPAEIEACAREATRRDGLEALLATANETGAMLARQSDAQRAEIKDLRRTVNEGIDITHDQAIKIDAQKADIVKAQHDLRVKSSLYEMALSDVERLTRELAAVRSPAPCPDSHCEHPAHVSPGQTLTRSEAHNKLLALGMSPAEAAHMLDYPGEVFNPMRPAGTVAATDAVKAIVAAYQRHATPVDPLAGLPAEERDRILVLAIAAEAETGLRSTAPWARKQARDATIAREVAAYHARTGSPGLREADRSALVAALADPAVAEGAAAMLAVLGPPASGCPDECGAAKEAHCWNQSDPVACAGCGEPSTHVGPSGKALCNACKGCDDGPLSPAEVSEASAADWAGAEVQADPRYMPVRKPPATVAEKLRRVAPELKSLPTGRMLPADASLEARAKGAYMAFLRPAVPLSLRPWEDIAGQHPAWRDVVRAVDASRSSAPFVPTQEQAQHSPLLSALHARGETERTVIDHLFAEVERLRLQLIKLSEHSANPLKILRDDFPAPETLASRPTLTEGQLRAIVKATIEAKCAQGMSDMRVCIAEHELTCAIAAALLRASRGETGPASPFSPGSLASGSATEDRAIDRAKGSAK